VIDMLEFLQPPGLLDGNPPSWYTVVRADELSPPTYDAKPRAARDGAEPRILILEPGDERDVFVSTYNATLAYITDTWYRTREAAIADCEERFGNDLGSWTPIPENESAEPYVLSRVSNQETMTLDTSNHLYFIPEVISALDTPVAGLDGKGSVSHYARSYYVKGRDAEDAVALVRAGERASGATALELKPPRLVREHEVPDDVRERVLGGRGIKWMSGRVFFPAN
jgi:hypothetical protein